MLHRSFSLPNLGDASAARQKPTEDASNDDVVSLSDVSASSPRSVERLQSTFNELSVDTPLKERVVSALQHALTQALPPVEIVSLEANIAAGKSTLMDALKRRYSTNEPDVLFLDEPVEKWMDAGLLQAFYRKEIEPAPFQLAVLMSLAGPLFRAVNARPKLIITERSPWSNFHTFAKVNLSGQDLNAYGYTFNELLAALPPVKVHMVYLKVSVATALARIQSRSRDSEDSVPEVYMQRLHDTHESLAEVAKPHRVITVDAERSPSEVLTDVTHTIDEILSQYACNVYIPPGA